MLQLLYNRCWSHVLLIVFLFAVTSQARGQQYHHDYRPLNSGSLVRDKNFYLLTVLEQLPAVRQLIEQNTVLLTIKRKKLEALQQAAANCQEDVSCHVQRLRWSDQDIQSVSAALEALCNKEPAISTLIKAHLRNSGGFEKYSTQTDAVLLVSAWKDAAIAMNRIMDVYALGIKGLYPLIDSVSYDVHSLVYCKNINLLVKTMVELPDDQGYFYSPALRFSLDLLDINMRNEAARLEPLDSVNSASIRYIRQIRWEKYKYTSIVIPGAGPDIDRAAIDPWAISRLRIAVDRFKKGDAPIFIVSGGYVKPFQTPFCEGLEMKKYLMAHFQIPEECIVLEPYARHTTTNIRNAARLMIRYKIPTARPALIITDWYQSKTIQSAPFRQRCKDELGYLPFATLTARSPVDTEFTPSMTSMHVDALDPLDP